MTRARPQIAMRTMVFLAQPPPTFQILSSVIAASRHRSPGRCLSAQALAGRRLFSAVGCGRGAGLPVCRQRYNRSTPLEQQAIAVAGMGDPVLQYYEDADYRKLREIAVAFDVPPTAAALIGARAASITLAGRNLATWTRYSGGDPEAGGYAKAFDSLGLSPDISDAGT